MTSFILMEILAAVVLVGAGGLWFAESRDRRQATRRISALAGSPERKTQSLRPLLRSSRRGPGVLFDAILGRETPLAAPLLVSRLFACVLGGLGAAIVYPLARVLFAAPVWMAGVVALAAFLLGPRLACRMSLARQRLRLLEQMPDAIGLLVRAARTGIPITEGVGVVARESTTPTSEEFREAAHATSVGTPLEEALDAMAQRTAMPEYQFFVTAIALQRETGGNLAETLDNLANVVRARKTLRLKAKALSSEARSSVYVLSALPFFSMVVLTLINPDYIGKLFFSEGGRMLLGIAGLLLTLGVGSMQLMIRRLG